MDYLLTKPTDGQAWINLKKVLSYNGSDFDVDKRIENKLLGEVTKAQFKAEEERIKEAVIYKYAPTNSLEDIFELFSATTVTEAKDILNKLEHKNMEVSKTNPYNLNIVPEGGRVIVHMENKDVSKGGIHLTENAKKELAAAAASNNSKLYYVIAVGESLVDHPRLKPGKWVLLSPDATGHSFKLDGKEMMMVESFHVAGVVTYHEEPDVENLYISKPFGELGEAEGRAHVDALNKAGQGKDGEQYHFIPKL